MDSHIISIISSVIALFSLIASLLTIKQNSKVSLLSSKADIVFYIVKPDLDGAHHSLVIRNFGKSSGMLTDISFKILNTVDTFDANHQITSLFPEFEYVFLAPNQSIQHMIFLKDYLKTSFEVRLNYKSLGKKFTNEYTIDLKYLNLLHHTKKKPEDLLEAVTYIQHNIQTIYDKLP